MSNLMPAKLYEEATLEVLRHLEDAEVSKLGHWQAAAVYDTRHRYFIVVRLSSRPPC